MFGHNERLRLGQIKHLTGAMANARFRVEAHAAHRTGRRIMIDDFVGISDLSQGLAFVTLLPTRFLAGPFTQTRHPRRLLQPIARRRLAAVRTVQSEPALKFGASLPEALLQFSGTSADLKYRQYCKHNNYQ